MKKKVKRKNKLYAGYIYLKPINGVIFPSYIQNQINKNFITKNLKASFFLSTNENEYSKNRIVLNSLINEDNKLKGIVMLSAFSLPENKILRSNQIDLKDIIYYLDKNALYAGQWQLKRNKNQTKEDYLNYLKDLFLTN